MRPRESVLLEYKEYRKDEWMKRKEDLLRERREARACAAIRAFKQRYPDSPFYSVSNEDVNPEASEVPSSGIDNDCDGTVE